MKLRNKKTGEIKDFALVVTNGSANDVTLAQLNEEWCDYEEPKEYWFINPEGEVVSLCEEDDSPEGIKASKQIGNYFETREEAKKAVEKLKAWKRLKDSGFRFNGGDDACISYRLDLAKRDDKTDNDFDLLFGGKE